MRIINTNVKDYLFYGGISREEYYSVRERIWDRNRNILKVTSLASAGMALFFLIFNAFTETGLLLPYAVLLFGSLLVTLALRLTGNRYRRISPALCYVQMLLVCVYATILSTQPARFATPATSVIVFIALMPMSIDDRPIRMYAFMLGESAGYLLVSRFAKSPEAFGLDAINIATFCLIGMVFYAVVCVRNVREIWQSVRMEKIQSDLINSLAEVVEERDENTGDHIQRTVGHVKTIIAQIKKTDPYRISDEFSKNVVLAAPMHDIGKIKIPDHILNKPGRLTPEEFEIMKLHTVYGGDIVARTMGGIEEKDYVEVARNIALYHHERFDGTGYPKGLKGTEIPLEARIMAIADVYDALVSDRVYKKAFSKETAKQILREGSGTQFDPLLAGLFLETR